MDGLLEADRQCVAGLSKALSMACDDIEPTADYWDEEYIKRRNAFKGDGDLRAPNLGYAEWVCGGEQDYEDMLEWHRCYYERQDKEQRGMGYVFWDKHRFDDGWAYEERIVSCGCVNDGVGTPWAMDATE